MHGGGSRLQARLAPLACFRSSLASVFVCCLVAWLGPKQDSKQARAEQGKRVGACFRSEQEEPKGKTASREGGKQGWDEWVCESVSESVE